MRHTNPNRNGFSLIELLVVIAIIAILAAIIFPVFNRVREQNRQEQCMQQMHDLYQAVSLFEQDNNKYPASLLGYAQIQIQNGSPEFYIGPGQPGATGSPLPVQQLTYKPVMSTKHVVDPKEFLCPDETQKDLTQVTTAVYPAGVPLAGQPVTFTQVIGHNTGYENDSYFKQVISNNNTYNPPVNCYFFKNDAYDVGPQLDNNGNVVPGVMELHYSLDWTGGSGPSDPTNQLKYTNVQGSRTVLTWCTYHAAVNHAGVVTLIFADGHTRTADAKTFVQKGPLNFVP